MKYSEIEAIYTEKVTEYIAKGYSINTNTMSGHQGEIAKIDLRKDGEIIRILMDTERDNHFHEAVVIIVGRNTDENAARRTGRSGYDTIWNYKLEVIEKRTFWQMQKDYRDVDFYLEGEAGEKALETRSSRFKARHFNPTPDKIFKDVEKTVVKAVKRHLNRTSFKVQNIVKVWKTWNEGRYIYKVQTLKHTITLG